MLLLRICCQPCSDESYVRVHEHGRGQDLDGLVSHQIPEPPFIPFPWHHRQVRIVLRLQQQVLSRGVDQSIGIRYDGRRPAMTDIPERETLGTPSIARRIG